MKVLGIFLAVAVFAYVDRGVRLHGNRQGGDYRWRRGERASGEGRALRVRYPDDLGDYLLLSLVSIGISLASAAIVAGQYR